MPKHFRFYSARIGRAQKAAMQIIPRKILRPRGGSQILPTIHSRWRFVKFFAAPEVAARHEAGIAKRYLQIAVRPTFASGKSVPRAITPIRYDRQTALATALHRLPKCPDTAKRNIPSLSFHCGTPAVQTASRFRTDAIREIRLRAAGYNSQYPRASGS